MLLLRLHPQQVEAQEAELLVPAATAEPVEGVLIGQAHLTMAQLVVAADGSATAAMAQWGPIEVREV